MTRVEVAITAPVARNYLERGVFPSLRAERAKAVANGAWIFDVDLVDAEALLDDAEAQCDAAVWRHKAAWRSLRDKLVAAICEAAEGDDPTAREGGAKTETRVRGQATVNEFRKLQLQRAEEQLTVIWDLLNGSVGAFRYELCEDDDEHEEVADAFDRIRAAFRSARVLRDPALARQLDLERRLRAAQEDPVFRGWMRALESHSKGTRRS